MQNILIFFSHNTWRNVQQKRLPLFLIPTQLISQTLYLKLKKKTELWKVNLNMETDISIWHIWIVDPSKWVFPLHFRSQDN